MKRLLSSLLLLLAWQTHFAQSPALAVMTFNIRYNNPADSANAWPHRKEHVAAQVLFHGAQLVGVQEALSGQLTDLLQLLPAYRSVGVGRTDGATRGEYAAILYDTGRLQLLRSATFWLSETPTAVGSRGWDGALERIVTWAQFRDKITGKQFFHFNTHFDHQGVVARRESAHVLLRQVAAIAGSSPVLVTGDFNAVPSDEPIRVVTDKNDPLHLTDSKALSATPHYGPTGTFNGFGTKERDDDPIDYIFIRNGNWKVLSHATLSETWGGRFSSDHFPVLAVVAL